jgi:hypothetical protein
MLNLLKTLKSWWLSQPRVRQILWLLLVIGWLVLLFLASRPFGWATYSLYDQTGNYFIHKLGPAERWSTSSDDLILTGQPGYFFLRPTRPFSQAEITVTWRPRVEAVYLEAGVLMDQANWQYQVQPLNHPGLNKLDWPVLISGSHHLWQKQPTYSTWEQFLATPPALDKLAVYNWSPTSVSSSQPDNYQIGQTWQNIPGHWRGIQQIITYLADNETLAWRLAITSDALKDLTADERRIEVNITNSANQRLWSEQRFLDGDYLEWPISAGPWPAGAYRLEIKASRQLLINLATKQTVFGWQGQVWPVAPAGFKWQFWTDAPRIIAQTIQPASRQVIKVNQQSLDIKETYQQYQIETAATSTEISLSGGDIQLAGNGIFSLKPVIFNPQLRRVNQLSDAQLASFDFIAANYQAPICNQQFCSATAKLSLIGANWQSGDGYKIMLAADNSQLSTTSPLIIKEIKIKLSGQTWLQFLRSLPRRLINKLK